LPGHSTLVVAGKQESFVSPQNAPLAPEKGVSNSLTIGPVCFGADLCPLQVNIVQNRIFALCSVEEFDGHEQPVSYEWQPGPLHLLPGAIPLLRWPCRGLENVQRPIFLF